MPVSAMILSMYNISSSVLQGRPKKCPSSKIAVHEALFEIFSRNFQDLHRNEFAVDWESLTNIFSVSAKLWLFNYSMQIFQKETV